MHFVAVAFQSGCRSTRYDYRCTLHRTRCGSNRTNFPNRAFSSNSASFPWASRNAASSCLFHSPNASRSVKSLGHPHARLLATKSARPGTGNVISSIGIDIRESYAAPRSKPDTRIECRFGQAASRTVKDATTPPPSDTATASPTQATAEKTAD